MVYPKHLHPGDCVGLAAPAFPVTWERLECCIKALEGLGLRVKAGENLRRDSWTFSSIGEKEGRIEKGVKGYLETFYLAGRPQDRAEDINQMFADPEIKGIACVRGGYGSAQIMRYLNNSLIRENPKIFLGYSDLTNLLNWFSQHCGFVSYHGPMVSSNMVDSPMDAYTKSQLDQTIFCDWEEILFKNPEGESLETIAPGRAEGELIGGNVSVFARMTGTFYQTDTRGKILFFEDVSEQVASLDMYFTQMDQAGLFDGVKGILFGDFHDCENRYQTDYQVENLLRDRFSDRKIPVISHLCCGHKKTTGTLPIGAWCRMDADRREICFVKR